MQKKEKIVLQGAYGVINADDKYDTLSSPAIQTCVALRMYDAKNKVLSLAHIDTEANINANVGNVIKEMTNKGAEIHEITATLHGGDVPLLGSACCFPFNLNSSQAIYNGITNYLRERGIASVHNEWSHLFRGEMTYAITADIHGKCDIKANDQQYNYMLLHNADKDDINQAQKRFSIERVQFLQNTNLATLHNVLPPEPQTSSKFKKNVGRSENNSLLYRM